MVSMIRASRLMPLLLRIAKNLTSTRLNMGLEIWRRIESHSRIHTHATHLHAHGSASLVNNSSTSGIWQVIFGILDLFISGKLHIFVPEIWNKFNFST